EHAAVAKSLYAVGVLVALRSVSAAGEREPGLAMGRSVGRVPGAAVGAHRRVLRKRVPDDDPSWRRARSASLRCSSHHSQTGEDPLMEVTHVHALDDVSVVRRRKWWLI